jgi:hypothetical protein
MGASDFLSPVRPLSRSHARNCIGNNFMPFVSARERLSEAVSRVIEETGSSIGEAQAAICQAITERAIRFWGTLRKQSSGPR